MSKELKFNDGLKSGSREPRLFIFKPNQEPVEFKGKAIDGIVAITKCSYTKQGKWSHSDFTLAVGDNTQTLEICPALHGKRFENYSSLEALMTRNNANYGSTHDFTQVMTPEQFADFLKKFFPVVWETFQTTQMALASLD